MEPEERIPGVTFYLRDATERKEGKNHLARVELEADIKDPELYNESLKRFTELRIYSIDDFKIELIEILQEDNDNLRQEKEHLEQQLMSAKEEIAHQLSLANRDKNLAELKIREQKEEIAKLHELTGWLQQLAES